MEEKKKYVKPEMDITEFDTEDVITTSGNICDVHTSGHATCHGYNFDTGDADWWDNCGGGGSN